MIFINTLISSIFDLFFYPFSRMPGIIGLLAISIVTGLVMLIIFKYTSNQGAIKQTKQVIKGLFLELRLYKDDLKQSLASQKRLLRTNLTYMKYSVIPMLVMIIPVILILIQMNFRFSNRALQPGDDVLVKLVAEPSVHALDTIKLEIEPEGVFLATKPLHIPLSGEVDWRVRVEKPGKYELVFSIEGLEYRHPLVVSNDLVRVYPEIMKPGFLESWLYPGAPYPPESVPIQGLSIAYPERTTPLLGFKIHWLITFLIVSIIAGFAVKKPFGVHI